MRYRVAKGNKLEALEQEVRQLMTEGYEPVGGIALSRIEWQSEGEGVRTIEAEIHFYQAMFDSSNR
jgi:hypothetical protein